MSQTANDTPLLPGPSLAEPVADLPAPPSAPPAPVEAPPMAAPPLSLDGEMPRLGAVGAAAAPAAPTANEFAPTVNADVEGLPTLPEAGSLAASFERAHVEPSAPTLPEGLDLPSLPSLPTAAPVVAEPTGMPAPDAGHVPTSEDAATEPASAPENTHPMAHLMGTKPPSEATRKANELRAAKKAKARKIKIGVAVGAIVFAVAVGPPLFRWLGNALDEAGTTSTEQPAD